MTGFLLFLLLSTSRQQVHVHSQPECKKRQQARPDSDQAIEMSIQSVPAV